MVERHYQIGFRRPFRGLQKTNCRKLRLETEKALSWLLYIGTSVVNGNCIGTALVKYRAQVMGLVTGRVDQMMGIDGRYFLINSECLCGGGVLRKKELRMNPTFQDLGRRLVVRQRASEKSPYEKRRCCTVYTVIYSEL